MSNDQNDKAIQPSDLYDAWLAGAREGWWRRRVPYSPPPKLLEKGAETYVKLMLLNRGLLYSFDPEVERVCREQRPSGGGPRCRMTS